MKFNDITALRLQLAAHGYLPTPNLDKRCVLKGWASPDFVNRLGQPGTIEAWAREHRGYKATGILVRNGLMAVDLDILDAAMIEELLDRLQDIAPDVAARAPLRTGRFPKLMALVQWQQSTKYPDRFRRIASDKFIDETGAGHQIEIFGGGLTPTGQTSKQIGAFGPHSYAEDTNGRLNFKQVTHEYTWDDVSPLTVPLSDLPRMTQDDAWRLIEAFEEMATARGWRRQAPPPKGAGRFQYDITDTTRFQLLNGPDDALYADLDEGMRCSGSFIDGSTSRRDKCRVSWCNAASCLGVYDTENDTWHLPEAARPLSTEEHNEAFREALAKLQAARPQTTSRVIPPKPKADDGLTRQTYWLLETHGFCPLTDRVVELYTPSEECQLRPTAFRTQYSAWREESTGERGGKHVHLATSAWQIHPDRPTVRGVRMRPDRDFPLYEEDGDVYKNTYLKPAHAGAEQGEANTFRAFIEHLLPIEEEREWFLNWLAHKHRYPDIPGVAIIMVAAGPEGPVYGAGRGMLRDILARLLGHRYVTTIDFDIFTGRSSQGVYTDWAAYSVLVTVSEAKDTADSGKWSAQRAVYERLKEVVDPRPIERTFHPKGQPAFRAPAFASYVVFSNNFDAVQLPADDRRVTVLRNGGKLPPERAMQLQAWMDQPANIAAMVAFLESRDLSTFDVYTPLQTQAKATMQELARTELDDAYLSVRRRIGTQRLFTGEQVRQAIMEELGDLGHNETLKHQITRRLRSDATQVSDYRLRALGHRHKILAWRDTDLASVPTVLSQQQAAAMVEATEKVLRDPTSVTIAFPVPGSGPG